MDKQGKTITIKINGKDRLLKTDRHVEKEKNGGELLGNRDETLLETAAAKDSFDWILPDPVAGEPPKEYKIAPKPAKKLKGKVAISVWNKKGSQSKHFYTRIFLTVFFAILLGSAFGVTILKLVTSEEPSALQGAFEPAEKNTENPPAGSESLDLASLKAFIVQNGVFTTEDAAKARLDLLREKGVGAQIFTFGGQYAIYMGIAGSIEEAKKNSEEIQAKGIEVFAKPVEVAGGKVSSLNESEADFLRKAPEIYSILTAGIVGTAEDLKKVKDYHSMVAAIADKDIKDKNIRKAKAGIENASKAFIAYQSTKDEKLLSESRNGLLSFLSAYQAIGN